MLLHSRTEFSVDVGNADAVGLGKSDTQSDHHLRIATGLRYAVSKSATYAFRQSKSQISVKLRLAQPFSPNFAFEHQRNNAAKERKIDNCERSPSLSPRRLLRKWDGIESKRERECLASKVQKGRNFRRLWFVALL